MLLRCFFFGFNTSFSVKPPAWCVSCYLLTTHTPSSFPLPPCISVWTLYSLKTSNVIIFSGLGLTWVSFLTIARCHTVMTASPVLFSSYPCFLCIRLFWFLFYSCVTVFSTSFSLPFFTFNLTSQSSCVTPFSASVEIAVSNSFSPQNEHHFWSPSPDCFCSTILARSSPPLQPRLVQSAPLCESHLQRWKERILYTVSKVWSYCKIKVTGQLQIKCS